MQGSLITLTELPVRTQMSRDVSPQTPSLCLTAWVFLTIVLWPKVALCSPELRKVLTMSDCSCAKPKVGELWDCSVQRIMRPRLWVLTRLSQFMDHEAGELSAPAPISAWRKPQLLTANPTPRRGTNHPAWGWPRPSYPFKQRHLNLFICFFPCISLQFSSSRWGDQNLR